MAYTAQLAEALLGGGRKGRSLLAGYGALTVLVLLEARAGIPWLGPHLTKIYLPFYRRLTCGGEYQPRITAHFSPELWKKLVNGIAIAGGIQLHRGGGGHGSDGDERHPGLRAQNLASFGGCISVIVFFTGSDGRCKRFLAWLGQYTLEDLFHPLSFCPDLHPGTAPALYTVCLAWDLWQRLCPGMECVDGANWLWRFDIFKGDGFLLYGKEIK